MPLRARCHEQAAEQLLNADTMLAACPHHEGAKCARVEVPLPLCSGLLHHWALPCWASPSVCCLCRPGRDMPKTKRGSSSRISVSEVQSNVCRRS